MSPTRIIGWSLTAAVVAFAAAVCALAGMFVWAMVLTVLPHG